MASLAIPNPVAANGRIGSRQHGLLSASYCHSSLSRKRSRAVVYASSSLDAGEEEGRRDEKGKTLSSILGMTRAMTSKGASLSMKQRWRAIGLYLEALRQHLVEHVAVIRALVAWYQKHVAGPYGVLADRYTRMKEDIVQEYEQYLADETKSRWSWEKRNRKELAFLHSIPPYIGMACVTVVYQAFIPLSISAAVLLPLYLSWVLYDRWWASPIILGMVLISRWKFLVPASWCWIWPGLF
ncbi:hypothetical protein M9435_003123 [Picochlorum sp. BPE23]|nr:hypothetical protein M9435_003123 [Picochlorum sp. BPE23]